jgi:hypothetical protein
MREGATELRDLLGNGMIPKETASGDGYWLASGTSAPSEGTLTLVQVEPSPKAAAVYMGVSRGFRSNQTRWRRRL